MENLARLLAKTDVTQHADLIAQFHNAAGQLPYVDDCDFGALVLEQQAELLSDDLKRVLLTEALRRAQWCAQAATAGGEGLARMVHVNQLAQNLTECGG